MVYAEFLLVAKDVPALFERNDDDMYDRMSHRWTSAFLLVFALISTASNYVGDPMHCWVPAHFKGGWEKYTNNYCWVRNTWYLPMESQIPKEIEDRERREIIYYQWVPIIFMFQALMFFFPIIVWRSMNSRTGVDMNDIIETAEKVQSCQDDGEREKRLYHLTRQTHRYLGTTKKPPVNKWSPRWLLSHCFCVCCGKNFGNYITALYIVIKVVFLINIIGQLFVLNGLLGHNFANFGIYVLQAMFTGQDWTWESERFPRVTMCDLNVRRLGNNHRYSVQCVLTINLFTEKMFLIIWFLFMIVAIFTLIGLILLLLRVFFRSDRLQYITKHLELGGMIDHNRQYDTDLVEKFVTQYLMQDGVLLMRLVGHNTNAPTINALVCHLFEHYKTLPHVMKGIEAAEDEFQPLEKPNELRELRDQ